ncbi:MAG: hypothetical protein ACXVH7_03550, partial [Thermoanaerobaculia bacterium]
MFDVIIGRRPKSGGVEMPVMAINELADVAHLHFTNFSIQTCSLLMQNFYRGSQALIALSAENFFTVRRQGSALPGSAVLCRAKELPQQAQPPWLGAAEPAGRHRHVAR